MVFGSYHENIFFTLLAIFLLYSILFEKNKSQVLIIIFGFICGLSLWVHFSFLITILIIFLVWYANDHRFFITKKFLLFVISFLFGFSLWIIYNIKFNFAGIKYFFEDVILEGTILHPVFLIKKLFSLVSYKLPMVFEFNNRIYNYIYYIVFCASFIILIYKNNFKRFFLSLIPNKKLMDFRKNEWLEMVIIMHFLLYGFAYIISSYERIAPKSRHIAIEFNTYLYTFLPFLFLIIVFFISSVITKKKDILTRCLSVILIIFILITGSYGITNISVQYRNNKNKLISPAFDYKLLYVSIGHKLKDRLEYFKILQERVPKLFKPYFYYGLGLGLGDDLEYGRPLETIVGTISSFDEEYRKFIYIAMGTENGGAEGENFLKKGPPNLSTEYFYYYNIGLAISDLITDQKRFSEMNKLLEDLPKISQKTIKEFINSLNDYIIPYQCVWQRKDRNALNSPKLIFALE